MKPFIKCCARRCPLTEARPHARREHGGTGDVSYTDARFENVMVHCKALLQPEFPNSASKSKAWLASLSRPAARIRNR